MSTLKIIGRPTSVLFFFNLLTLMVPDFAKIHRPTLGFLYIASQYAISKNVLMISIVLDTEKHVYTL